MTKPCALFAKRSDDNPAYLIANSFAIIKDIIKQSFYPDKKAIDGGCGDETLRNLLRPPDGKQRNIAAGSVDGGGGIRRRNGSLELAGC